MDDLIAAIVNNDRPAVLRLLGAEPSLAKAAAKSGATRQNAPTYFLPQIEHYIYAGDTALHIAAAAYRASIINDLIEFAASIAAANRRGAQPLHYAVDGVPGSQRWNPAAQGETVVALLQAGADPNATDKSGVTPLHRAVRARCAAAVEALLCGGADPKRPNRSGSTPLQLAEWTPPAAVGVARRNRSSSKKRSCGSCESTAPTGRAKLSTRTAVKPGAKTWRRLTGPVTGEPTSRCRRGNR